MYGSLTGGGTLEITQDAKRIRMLEEGARFTGTIKIVPSDRRAGYVFATTIQSGTEGNFVCEGVTDGDGRALGVKKTPDAYGNYDWMLAYAPTVTAPEANDPVYTGGAQALVTAGSAEGGEMQYSADGVNYSTAIPEGTDAGTYEVYYRVVGDSDHTDIEPVKITVEIKKAGRAAPDAPVLDSKTADSITVLAVPGVEYSIDGGAAWQTGGVFSGLASGQEYNIIARIPGDANHETSSSSEALTVKLTSGSSGSSGGGVTAESVITASAGEGGSISPAGTVRIRRRADRIFKIAADDGYIISDVLVDGESVGPAESYTFEKVSADHTIHAVFKAVGPSYDNCHADHTCPIYHFTDADSTRWYHDGLHYCLDRSLLRGYGDGTIRPNRQLSRAELAQVLYNSENRPGFSWDNPFADVGDGTWYNAAITWAAGKDVVEGYGNGDYGPNDPITREQLAVMLWRMAGRPDATDSLSGFTDGGEAGGWAETGLRWAVEKGILLGYGDGTLRPRGSATRAEAATMLMRYFETDK